jgi:hypothetical protein
LTVEYLNAKNMDSDPMTMDRIEELHEQYPDTPNLRRKKSDG